MLERILKLPYAGNGRAASGNGTPTFETPYAPLPVRWGNALMRRLDPRRRGWPALSREALIETAERRTGLCDWGEPSQRQALASLADCLAEESRLTPFGRLTVSKYLLRHLMNRLLVVDAMKRFPEVRDVEIREPIFIVGWYRTGTTFLHNLLATSPKLRAPLFWELRHPCAPGDPRSRNEELMIRGVRRTRRIHRYLAPDFETVHPIAADGPEECLHLFENAGVSLTSCFISEAKSFAWWLLEQDLRPAYRFYREQLQLLQWLQPSPPSPQGVPQWLLKWPYHLWHLDALFEVFPDARVVHTHRDPLKALPSVCSLAAIARSPMCESVDAVALGRFWLEYFEAGLERCGPVRRRMDPSHFCDIDQEDLRRDPAAMVERIHECLGLGLTSDLAPRIERYLDANAVRKKRVHRYGLEQFGLDAGEVRERLNGAIPGALGRRPSPGRC